MSLEKNHTIYTAEDIQQYLSGKLTPAEMHAVEKAALEDEFLAEAIEGYSGMQEDWKRELAALKNDFSKNQDAKIISIKRVNKFGAWKIAAASLIICSGLAITYKLTRVSPSSTKSVAVISDNHDSIKRQGVLPVADSINSIAAASDHKKNKPGSLKEITTSPFNETTAADSQFLYRPEKGDTSQKKTDTGGGYVDDNIKNAKNLSTTNNANPVAAQNNIELNKNKIDKEIANPEINANLKKTAPLFTKKFVAQVVAPDGAPLPFANVAIPRDNIGTYADAGGKFRLVSADSQLNIEIKSAGYMKRAVTLKSNIPINKIVLAEDTLGLNEIVVGGGALRSPGRKKRSLLMPDSATNVEPEDGWNNYDTYLSNNLSFSNDMLKTNIHGDVEVSFDVQNNGALTNLKIDKSLCADCDEAALRAIKEGPRWKIKKGRQSRGKIKVSF